jgi:hypothetical protein
MRQARYAIPEVSQGAREIDGRLGAAPAGDLVREDSDADLVWRLEDRDRVGLDEAVSV